MPTYDYVCDACGHAFELYQSFKDDPIAECPSCAGPVRRIIAPTAIIFKGSGWYATDSKRPTSGLIAGKSSDAKSEGAKPDAASGSEAEAPPASAGKADSAAPAKGEAD